MKLNVRLAALALAAGLAAVTPAMAEVTVVQAPFAALARGSSFAWAPVPGMAVGDPAPAIVNQITTERLQVAIESVLLARGYRKVENAAEADLIVAYGVLTAKWVKAELKSPGGFCQPPFCAPWDNYSLETSEKTRGALVLDLTNRRTGQLVYRAVSEKDVGSKDTSSKRLVSALKEMTKALPSE